MQRQNRLFVACIIALVATSFGFITRALLLKDLGIEFNLSEAQKGALNGAGLFPFALSIIFFSLIVDRVGYGRCMVFAFLGHTLSGIIVISADSFEMLYVGTLLFALANGTVEAVINPATTTLFPKSKTHHLNILHAGWPAGLVLGGLLFILLKDLAWQWKLALYLIPTAAYGFLLLGQRFPEQERVKAGISYEDMLKEFGWAGCYIVCLFAVYAIDSVVVSLAHLDGGLETWHVAALAAVPAALFGLRYRSFGRPMFVMLLLVMILLATTELGTDQWITDIMAAVLKGTDADRATYLVLIYTSAIMFVLRFFAGPIVHRISPLGLLASCASLACIGLVFLANAGSSVALIFLAATVYAVGKTFFWPTTLGVVSEQFPKGGAMTINAIGGMGMISVGILGGPFLGAMQDDALDRDLRAAEPALHAVVAGDQQTTYLMEYQPLDKGRIAALPAPEKARVDAVIATTKQATLAKIAVLPAIMLLCYLGLILHFRKKGGYRPVDLAAGG